MRIVIYGGSFDPPHLGHAAAAKAAYNVLNPDKMLIIPDCVAPHKIMAGNSAAPEDRMELCRYTFGDIPGVEISDIEVSRGGKSYTSDTLHQLMELYPGDEFFLMVGTDMLVTFDGWHDFRWILDNVTLAAFPRENDDGPEVEAAAARLREKYGARVELVPNDAVPVSSTDVRGDLAERGGRAMLEERSYAYIVAKRLYGAKPEFAWLREKSYAYLKPKRIPHVAGCEQEAVKLAERWGADADKAAECGILHDISKKLELDEQLILCEKYGIIADNLERTSTKLLHARTGAALARELFGCDDEVCSAIRWHTTGKPDMSLLEKIIYMADYIEPTRSFDGVEKLRELAYEDLDAAMILGLEMSIEDILSYNEEPHKNSMEALAWLKAHRQEK